MLPRYYLNDYFTLIDSPILKEREFMKTDIREYQNKYIMEIDLPGLKKEDIIINYENGYLTIKATKNVELKTEVYVRRERFYGEVKRSFYIGEKKETDIKANYEGGILATKKLLEFGCKSPVFIGFHSPFPGEADKRFSGYLDTCRKYQIPPVYLHASDSEDPYVLIHQFIKKHENSILLMNILFPQSDSLYRKLQKNVLI